MIKNAKDFFFTYLLDVFVPFHNVANEIFAVFFEVHAMDVHVNGQLEVVIQRLEDAFGECGTQIPTRTKSTDSKEVFSIPPNPSSSPESISKSSVH